MTAPLFHLAFPVSNLEEARRFYAGVLDCEVGRESARWIDFDFQGHQITAHLSDTAGDVQKNEVDGDRVPSRHFGLILNWAEWEALAEHLRSSGVDFLIEPRVRFAGKPGEQGTFFVLDPSGNALEFKSFKDSAHMFSAKQN